jgi:hypothetical protein
MNKQAMILLAGFYKAMMKNLDPDSEWDVVDDVEGLTQVALIVNDMNITDLMVSRCGRFNYDLAEAGPEYGVSLDVVTTLGAVNKYLKSLQE